MTDQRGAHESGMDYEQQAPASWQDPPGTISVDNLRRWAAVADDDPTDDTRPLVICSNDALDACRAAVAGHLVDVIGSPNLPHTQRVVMFSATARRLAGI